MLPDILPDRDLVIRIQPAAHFFNINARNMQVLIQWHKGKNPSMIAELYESMILYTYSSLLHMSPVRQHSSSRSSMEGLQRMPPPAVRRGRRPARA